MMNNTGNWRRCWKSTKKCFVNELEGGDEWTRNKPQSEWVQKTSCDHTADTAPCFVQVNKKRHDGAQMVMWSHNAIWFTWEVMAHMTRLCGIERCITMVYHSITQMD